MEQDEMKSSTDRNEVAGLKGMDEKKTERVPTFGEKAVGVSFNPSKLPEVDAIKQIFASAIDQMNAHRRQSGNGDQSRYISTAITNAEVACMLAVKALTWQY